jgi:hypothetical protein
MMLSAAASFDKAHSVFGQLIESWTHWMLELIVSN